MVREVLLVLQKGLEVPSCCERYILRYEKGTEMGIRCRPVRPPQAKPLQAKPPQAAKLCSRLFAVFLYTLGFFLQKFFYLRLLYMRTIFYTKKNTFAN